MGRRLLSVLTELAVEVTQNFLLLRYFDSNIQIKVPLATLRNLFKLVCVSAFSNLLFFFFFYEYFVITFHLTTNYLFICRRYHHCSCWNVRFFRCEDQRGIFFLCFFWLFAISLFYVILGWLNRCYWCCSFRWCIGPNCSHSIPSGKQAFSTSSLSAVENFILVFYSFFFFFQISHYEVVNALLAAVQKRVAAVKDVPSWGIGVIATVGHFYDGPLGNQNRLWEASRVLGIEMEASVLLTIGGIRGIRTGCLANVDNYIFERELSGTYAPHRDVVLQGTTRMIEIAMDAMAALSSDQVTVN